MTSSQINLVMTVIGFAVSTMFIVFVCTRLICARIQLNAFRRSLPFSARSDLSILERGFRGLEPLVVSNFPTKKYKDAGFSSSGDVQCTICLADYHGEDILRIIPYCGHSFHTTCIDTWLHQHSTCPVCRISLRKVPDKKRMQPIYSLAFRSQYRTEIINPHFGLASRAYEDHWLETIPDNQIASEGRRVESGEGISILSEGIETVKSLENKHVESPSNT